jgi:hypothetical protein
MILGTWDLIVEGNRVILGHKNGYCCSVHDSSVTMKAKVNPIDSDSLQLSLPESILIDIVQDNKSTAVKFGNIESTRL